MRIGVGGVGYGVVGEGSGLDGRVRRVDGWGIGGLRWWGKLGVGGEGNGVVGEGGGLREGSGGGWLGVWGLGGYLGTGICVTKRVVLKGLLNSYHNFIQRLLETYSVTEQV